MTADHYHPEQTNCCHPERSEGSMYFAGLWTASLRLGFHVAEIGIESVFGDSLAPVELIDLALDLRVDRFPTLQAPAIMLLLRFKRAGKT